MPFVYNSGICNAREEMINAGLLEDTGYNDFYTLSYNQSPQQHYEVATVKGNTLTGYYSDKAKCTGYPGNGPGTWKTASQWQSTCSGVGVKRELTLLDLYKSTSCIYGLQPGYQNEFCDSLTDQGGNPRKPILCGGTDPNVFTYNPSQVALEGLSGVFESLQGGADDISSELVLENRKKIFGAAFIVLALIGLLFLIFSK